MNEPKGSVAISSRPAKMRSRFERLVVWSGVLVLLILVFVEWTSRRNFGLTLDDLEGAVRKEHSTGGVSLNDAGRYVHGFAFQGTATKNQQRQRTYRWPSLFIRYQLAITIDPQDKVTFVETFVPEVESAIGNFTPVAVDPEPLSKRGLPLSAPQVFALNTNELLGADGHLEAGSLTREIIRQGLLIAAREELGLSTADSSIGERLAETEFAQLFPFDLEVQISRTNGAFHEVTIDLSRPNRDGKRFRLPLKKFLVSIVNWLESLVERVEVMSRDEFVVALREAGFQKSQVKPVFDEAIIPSPMAPLDFVSQFALLRRLHPRMRANGESAETIGPLICAYANLGHLTDYHWSPTSKAFKARALLYAQRFLTKQGHSPLTVAHRAYARALAGRHATALDDIREARAATGPAAPGSLDLIDAFCAYKLDILEDATGPFQELAAYLRMRLADPVYNVEEALRTIQRFAELNPGCVRSAELLCEVKALGVRRMAIERGFDQMWPDVYSHLANIDDLPAAARKIADQESRQAIGPDGIDSGHEHRSRMELIEVLELAGASERDHVELTWAVLADLLRDVTFQQVWRQLDLEANALVVNSDLTLAELRPLVVGHRLEKFILSFTSDPNRVAELLTQLNQSMDVSLLELPAAPLSSRFYYRSSKALYDRAVMIIAKHGDQTFEDLKRRQMLAVDNLFNGDLNSVSPFHPTSIVKMINENWDDVKDRAMEWERSYGKNPLVLQALAEKYRQSGRLEDAERSLTKSIDASATHAAYRELANLYQERGDLKQCKETLELALELPNYGLEDAQIRTRLAKILMREGDWDGARVHAFNAATSYAEWALSAAARCAEATEDWTTSEAYRQAISERYTDRAADWYFWCLRTGHGNVAAARSLAKRYWQSLNPPFNASQRWSRGIGYILDADIQSAVMALTDSIDVDRNVYSIMQAAVLVDQLGDDANRDVLFDKVLSHWNEGPALRELIDLFRRALAGKEGFHWNRDAFESLIVDSANSDVTFLYYFAGKLVGKHGQQKLSQEYLECAATSFDVNAFVCLLATHALKQQKLGVGFTRAQELPDDLAPLAKLLESAHAAEKRQAFDVALSCFAQAIESRPNFPLSLIYRGVFHENRGNYQDAIADYNRALQIDPDFESAHRRLAWLFSTCERDDVRNGVEALKHALRAHELREVKTWENDATLAAAYAECGDFTNAENFESKSNSTFMNNRETWKRLKLYREKKPYRHARAEGSSSGSGT